MAVELATGYVSLVPSAEGIADKIADELDLDAVALAAGKSAGDKVADGLLGQTKDTGEKLLKALGLAAVGALAIKSATDVEDANNIIIRSTGATGAAAEGLEASFRKVASGSSASLETVATTLSELYQRTGLQGKALEGLTSQVVTFNRISKDSPITVDALTKATAGYNVEGSKMGATLDHLFVVSQKTGEPLAQLLSDLGTSGPVLRQFGFGIDGSAEFLAKLNKAGLDSSQIIPGLKRVLQDAAKEGKAPADALRDLLTQLEGLIRTGDVIAARSLAQQIFGARGTGLVDAVVSGKLSLQDLDQQVKITGDGILETAGKTSTLSGTLGVFRNNAELAFAGFATPALQTANDVLKSLLPTVQDLGKDFAELPDPIKLGAVAAVGLAVGLGKIGTFVTNAGPGLKAMGEAASTAFVLARVRGSELIDTLHEMTLAEVAAQAAPFAIAAGFVALGFALHEALGADLVGELNDDLKKGTQAGKDWANALIAGATASKDPIGVLDRQIATTRQEFAQYRAEVDRGQGAHDFDSAVAGAARYKTTLDTLTQQRANDIQAGKQQAEAAATTARALDQYTASTEAGSNATSALSKLNDDAKKTLNDLQSALIQATGGPLAYQEALLSLQKAQGDVTVANQNVTDAQNKYNDALATFGPDSQQALLTWVALGKAQQDQVQAQLNVQEANQNVGQSLIAVQDNEQKLIDSIAGGGKTRDQQLSSIDAEIAKLNTLAQSGYPGAAAAIGPYLDQLAQLRANIAGVEGPHNASLTFDVSQAVANIDYIIGLLGGPNAPAAQQLGFAAGFAGGAIPGAATGALLEMPQSGGLAVLHGEEAVLPLNDPARSWDLIAQSGLLDTMQMPAGVARGGDVHITYAGPLDDPVARTRGIFDDLERVRVLQGLG